MVQVQTNRMLSSNKRFALSWLKDCKINEKVVS